MSFTVAIPADFTPGAVRDDVLPLLADAERRRQEAEEARLTEVERLTIEAEAREQFVGRDGLRVKRAEQPQRLARRDAARQRRRLELRR